MKTDKELLELAAKAAGLSVAAHGVLNCGAVYLVIETASPQIVITWSPLTDDGDALRLAVKLDMQVTVDIGGGEVWVVHNYLLSMIVESLEGVVDIYAATRRAIVRAAAAIGESK